MKSSNGADQVFPASALAITSQCVLPPAASLPSPAAKTIPEGATAKPKLIELCPGPYWKSSTVCQVWARLACVAKARVANTTNWYEYFIGKVLFMVVVLVLVSLIFYFLDP